MKGIVHIVFFYFHLHRVFRNIEQVITTNGLSIIDKTQNGPKLGVQF